MSLKRLELTGFKSFARKSALEFKTAITAIVGPNGSGKSNTAEAFRFVLGEQSIKSLRGKRGEDMIWNGGGGDGRANRASVKLVFDNSSKLFPAVDFDEVILERVVHRDNTNEYLMNGSQVRLKDVVELLAAAHIGATGHHIISQGEADRILSASIRERREMIEDALGLKLYQWKKLESLRKLEKTQENVKQVESLRREIAPHLKFLKKQVEKVEKGEELRRELVELYRYYFASATQYVDTTKRRLEHDLMSPRAEMSNLETELNKAKQILTESKNKDKKSDEIIALERKRSEIRLHKDDLMREIGRLEGEIAANQRTIDKERDKQARDEFRTVYVRDVEDVVKEIEGLGGLTDVRELFSRVVTTLKQFIIRHRASTDSSAIGEAEKEIATLTADKKKTEQGLAELSATDLTLLQKYNELKDTIEREKDTNREAEKDVFRIIARQNEVRNHIEKLSAELSTVVHEETQLKRELGEAALVAGREAVQIDGLLVEVAQYDRAKRADLAHKIERTKIRLEESGAAGGAEVIREFKETEERDLFLARELADLDKAKEELNKLIVELDARIDFEFKNGILKINSEFQKYFTLMFGGGKAELSVVREQKRKKKSDLAELGDMLDENQKQETGRIEDGETSETEGPEGLDVSVNLPRKKVKSLMMLSGGERALTSIALLFAISQVNPPPFIILDETDAALDEANSKKYGDMIESLAKHSQLILITHNRETMSRAGVLYGVTMGSDGASRLLSIQFDEAIKVAK